MFVDEVDESFAADDDHGRARQVDLARPARDQLHRDDVVHRRRRVAVESSEQKVGRRPADRLRILGDDRDRRVEDVGERDVVEADQRDPAFEPGAPERPDAADREEVLAGEERRRRVGEREQRLDGGRGGFGVTKSGPDQLVVAADPGLLERLAVPL